MQHISHDLTIVAPFQVGDLVRVHWPSHDDWYNGTILEIGSPQELKCGAVEHADLREQRQEMHSLGLHGFKKHLKDVHWTDSDGIGGLQAQHGDPGAVTQMPAGGPGWPVSYITGNLRIPKTWPVDMEQSVEARQWLLNEADAQQCACGT